MAELQNLPAAAFYDLRHATIFLTLREMFRERIVIDLITVQERLKKKRQLREVGGLQYLMTLPNVVPSAANLSYYMDILKEKHALRTMIQACQSTVARIYEETGDVRDLMLGVQADLDTVSRLGLDSKKERETLKIWRAGDLAAYQIPDHLRLVGDNEISMGYEGVCVLAGPGSSGKSICTVSLALSGAIGSGFWMGRKVHRKFKTLIIQAENGSVRLKGEFEALKRHHPEADIENGIFISEPPEGGLPFHRGEFRRAVREQIERIKPDLVILDPWSMVATEDAAKEVVDKLAEIRSCFPSGDQCPGLLIVAHTKKPRPEDVRKGRGLVYLVSGSIALPNTARCVYVLLPWSDDPEDDRCYWCTPKLNNGQMYAATVWKRRFGTFFEHDAKTNPREWGKNDDDREKITEEHLRACFEKEPELQSGRLVTKLGKISGAGESTCWRAIGEDGYLRCCLQRTAHGRLRLKVEE